MRGRLDHVDAMRPVKQLGVLTTHSMMYFAPSVFWLNASITLLHVSREGFLFISACMLTYAYYDISTKDLGRFWRRRLLAVGLPYLTWTLIYFGVGLITFKGRPSMALEHLGYITLVGYFQLYFLVVLIQFYVLFPFIVWFLKKTSRHHVAVLVVSLAVQIAYTSLLHWQVLPEGTIATREVMSYQFYLLAGCLAAVHYDKMHSWIIDHKRSILLATIATAAFAEGCYLLSIHHSSYYLPFLGSSSDAFSPFIIPFNVAAIALIYVCGVELIASRRSTVVRHATSVGSDNSYSIYLSQVIFIQILVWLGWAHLVKVVPWPIVIAATVLIVFVCGCLLGGLVARTPLAMALAGRHQVSWASLRPWWLGQRRQTLPVSPETTVVVAGPSPVELSSIPHLEVSSDEFSLSRSGSGDSR